MIPAFTVFGTLLKTLYFYPMKTIGALKNLPGISLVAIALIMLMITSNINWGKDHWNQIVRSDGEGNYAYLPAVFIHHDLNFKFFNYYEGTKYHDPYNFVDYRVRVGEKDINKYWSGAALAMSPFYLLGHAWAGINGYDQDGFSKPYPISITFAALFYLMIGLWALSRTLKSYGCAPWMRTLVLFATLFGTNLFYYTVSEPSMNHVYSFGLIALFFFLMRSYFLKPSWKIMLFSGFILGIIMLIRPLNGIVILGAPFAAGSFSIFKTGLQTAFKKPYGLLGAVCLAFGVLFIQLLIYKISCGSFLVYSYGDESFDFRHPHMIDFLCSYKKGFFLYTPLALIAISGFWWQWKQSRFSFFALLFFLVFMVFLFSSWWSWWYGGSFSSRIMTDHLVLFGILLGFALMQVKARWSKSILIGLIFLAVILCQIQTFQYRYYQIHWEDMTKEKYWNVFLRVDKL